MNELKYIIVVPPGFNELMGARAIIFNGMVTHSTMVPPEFKVVSGGFMVLGIKKGTSVLLAKCHGRSESLDIDSNPAFDEMIIRRTLTRQHPLMGFMEDEG